MPRFFFSSRRRHTSCSRDWSSDVCSSDLPVPGPRRAHRDRSDDRPAGEGHSHPGREGPQAGVRHRVGPGRAQGSAGRGGEVPRRPGGGPRASRRPSCAGGAASRHRGEAMTRKTPLSRSKGWFDLRENLWRIVAVLGVLLLLNLGFYLLFNLPRLRSLQNLEERRNSAARDLRGTQTRCDRMRELLALHDEESKRLDDFYTNVLGSQMDRMTSIQKEVRSIATEFHIDPESIDYNSQEIAGSGMAQFQITIPLVGGDPNP